jgi:hypothetical protein
MALARSTEIDEPVERERAVTETDRSGVDLAKVLAACGWDRSPAGKSFSQVLREGRRPATIDQLADLVVEIVPCERELSRPLGRGDRGTGPEAAARERAGPHLASRMYDVSPDGQRFLMLKPAGPDQTAAPPTLVIVQHFGEDRQLPAAFRNQDVLASAMADCGADDFLRSLVAARCRSDSLQSR